MSTNHNLFLRDSPCIRAINYSFPGRKKSGTLKKAYRSQHCLEYDAYLFWEFNLFSFTTPLKQCPGSNNACNVCNYIVFTSSEIGVVYSVCSSLKSHLNCLIYSKVLFRCMHILWKLVKNYSLSKR